MSGAGTKLLGLAALAAILSFRPGIVAIAILGTFVVAIWWMTPLPWPRLWHAVRPLIWFLVPIVLIQTWTVGWPSSITTATSIVVLVIAAAWITETTRTTDLLAVITRATRSRTLGYAVVFLIRLVPTVATIGREVHEARRARGAGRNPLALVSPLLIRLLKTGDAVADALDARGFRNRVEP